MRHGTALRLLIDSLKRRGVKGTVARGRRLIAQRQAARHKSRESKAFDAERGIDTATWVRVPDLETASPNQEYAVRYEPSSVEEFTLLMEKLRRHVDVRDFTFVDYGSGKGRVLILAAEHPFERIVGVEFDGSLDRVARENVATLGADAARIETFVMDAVTFDPPGGPLVLYFFHPFGVPVLRPVLARLRASLEDDPRAAFIVITGPPELSEAVEEAGFERVDVDELGWLTRGVFGAPAGLSSPRGGEERGS